MNNKKLIIGLGVAGAAWMFWQSKKANAAVPNIPAPASAWNFTANQAGQTNQPATGNPVAPNYDTGYGINGNW